MEVKHWKKFGEFLGIATKYKGMDVATIRFYFWRDVWHDTEITLREIGEMTGGQTSGNVSNGLRALKEREQIRCKFTAQQKELYLNKKSQFKKLYKLE